MVSNFRIKLRTLVDVKKDEQLFVSYTFTLDGTAERQQHLKNGKYFTCRCERCCDPTELGSYFSSLICEDCDSGYISTINPLGMYIAKFMKTVSPKRDNIHI